MSRTYTPREYQPMGVNHILQNPRCGLWAGMGLGKTVMVYTALDILYALGEEKLPTLVMGPLRVARGTWPNQAKEWDHLANIEVSPIVGTEAERLAALKRDANVFTVNYDNLGWLTQQLKDKWPFGPVVADESTKLKGFRGAHRTHPKTGLLYFQSGGGVRARALGRVAHAKVTRWINLTGTPAPNGLIDLWGQTWFLDAGERLGHTFSAFEQRYFAYVRREDATKKSYEIKQIVLPHAQREIHEKLADICLTIDAKDWFDLKEPIVNDIYVDLPPKVRRLYRDMERDLYMEIESRGIEALNAASKTQKLLQLANGAVYLDPLVDDDRAPKSKEWRRVHDEKLQALESVFEEAAGAPVLVAYNFRSDLARLLKAFPKGRALHSQRDEDDFKEGKIPYLFCHPQSAGHGIDGFQNVCNIAAFFGHDWNLEHYQQIIERIGPVRQIQAGFDRPVFLHHIIARGTVDELVMQRRESKRSVQDILLEAMKRGVGE